jgi:hypothetical protein
MTLDQNVGVVIAFCLGCLFTLAYVWLGMELGLLVVPFVERYRCYFEKHKRYHRKKITVGDL